MRNILQKKNEIADTRAEKKIADFARENNFHGQNTRWKILFLTTDTKCANNDSSSNTQEELLSPRTRAQMRFREIQQPSGNVALRVQVSSVNILQNVATTTKLRSKSNRNTKQITILYYAHLREKPWCRTHFFLKIDDLGFRETAEFSAESDPMRGDEPPNEPHMHYFFFLVFVFFFCTSICDLFFCLQYIPYVFLVFFFNFHGRNDQLKNDPKKATNWFRGKSAKNPNALPALFLKIVRVQKWPLFRSQSALVSAKKVITKWPGPGSAWPARSDFVFILWTLFTKSIRSKTSPQKPPTDFKENPQKILAGVSNRPTS